MGRFDSKLDEKGRLLLPSAIREILGSAELVMTNGIFRSRKCLDVYRMDSWENLERKILKLPSLEDHVQAFSRFYLASGQKLSVDNQSRLLIPLTLRKFAALEKSVVVVGMGEKFEIWNDSIWQELFDQLINSFEDAVSFIAELKAD